MLFIVLPFLCYLVASIAYIEFHLDKQLSLCCMNNITAITPLSNGGIAVEASKPSITILDGDKFSTKVSELQIDDSVIKYIVTFNGGVYFAYEDKIVRKATNDQANATFDENYRQSSMLNLEPQEKISDIGLKTIEFFDAQQDIISITGQSLTNSSEYKLVVKKFKQIQLLIAFPFNPQTQIVKLSQSGSILAIYGFSLLTVWNVKGPYFILQRQYENVVNLKFANDNQILLQFDSYVTVVSLKTNDIIKLNLNFTTITPNNDGTLFAALVNSINAKVLDIQMNEVANFIAPQNHTIVDLGFSQNGELYGITSNGTLFILSPTPCRPTYINVNSICLCSKNKTNTTGYCLCAPNFIQQGNECLCINGFTYDGEGCFCNLNASITGSSCICRQGFVLIGNQCICPNQLAYIYPQCIQCSVFCKTCEAAGVFDCTQFSVDFYVLIGGASASVLIFAIVVIWMIKKRKKNESLLESMAQNDQSGSKNSSLVD